MKSFSKSLFVWAVAALSLFAGSVIAEGPAVLQISDQPMIGEAAPPFKLLAVDGQEISTDDLRGSYAVIHVAASW